jgi:predicted small secreted protein
MSSRLLLIASGVLLLPACNTTRNIGQEDPGLGEAMKYNAAVQTVNPEPVYPAGAAQPGDRRSEAGRGHADHERWQRWPKVRMHKDAALGVEST